MAKTAFITDFDGTATKVDFFQMVTESLLTPADMQPWHDYLAGKISHLEALNGIFGKIHLPQGQMDKFIASIEVDKYFYELLPLLKNLNIPVYICSAGSAYYIEKRIGEYIKEYDITLLSNGGVYSAAGGLKLIAPGKDDAYYDANTGISKEALVKHLKSEGYFVVYAGDGRPDFKAAKAADAVFARSALLELCKKHGIKFFKLESFKDIINYFKENYVVK